MRALCWLFFVGVVLVLVAMEAWHPSPEAPDTLPLDLLSRDFDPTRVGAIHGKVTWQGPLPEVSPFTVNLPDMPTKTEPNPHEPRIDSETRSVAGAVVYLQEVDLSSSRPWDHPPVRVILEDGMLAIHQGSVPGLIGVVRPGAEVEWLSKETEFASIRARGAAFFTLPFIHPRPTRRSLDKPGQVEVSSGAGAYWMRGHIFVSPHPYVCLTDEHGEFTLQQVPEGRYEVCCWLPNWEVDRLDIDPELRQPVRLHFRPPWQAAGTVDVKRGTVSPLSFTLPAVSR